MESILLLFVVIAVPVLGLTPVWFRDGRRVVRSIAVLAALMVLASLALASPHLGNRLAGTDGYWPVAGRILAVLAFSVGLPVGLEVAAMHVVAGQGAGRRWVVLAGLLAGACGWGVGIGLLFAVVWR